MADILINKNSGSNYTNYTFDVNINELKTRYRDRVDAGITELSSADNTLYLDKDDTLSIQEKIEKLIADYTDIRNIIPDEDLIDLYELIRSDLPYSYLHDRKEKLNVLDIDYSQGVLITNENYKINERNFINFNRKRFDDPQTYTCWIKPLSKNYQRKTLVRQELTFEVESAKQVVQPEPKDERIVR